jgi:hypothetical protein
MDGTGRASVAFCLLGHMHIFSDIRKWASAQDSWELVKVLIIIQSKYVSSSLDLACKFSTCIFTLEVIMMTISFNPTMYIFKARKKLDTIGHYGSFGTSLLRALMQFGTSGLK